MERAFRKWSSSETVTELSNAMKTYAQCGVLEKCAPLASLLSDAETAREFTDEWSGHFSRALATEALGLIPFRHSYSPGLSTLQLIAMGHASLSLVTYEEKAFVQPAPTAIFADRSQQEIVIAGAAHGYIHERNQLDGAIGSRACTWSQGQRIELTDGMTSREICRVEGRFVVLQLVRAATNPQPTCEYRLKDGVLLHRSCADKRVSQAEMALAVLGEMGRGDAVSVMADLAADGPEHLRWEALRHALVLDPLAGIDILTSMAGNTEDELHEPAARLHDQLKQTHPHLFAEETEPCPA